MEISAAATEEIFKAGLAEILGRCEEIGEAGEVGAGRVEGVIEAASFLGAGVEVRDGVEVGVRTGVEVGFGVGGGVGRETSRLTSFDQV